MIRSVLIQSLAAATALGMTAVAVTGASAHGVAQPGFYKGDLDAFHGNAQSLIQAIGAFHTGSDARVVEIRFSDRNGDPGYYAVLQKHGRVDFVHVDENGQSVELDSASLPDWMLSDKSKLDLRLDRKATIPLAQAISTAEAANGGAPAVAAGIARSASNPDSEVHAYNVLLDNGGRVQRVAIDSMSGQVISDPQALMAWP
jgi:uncharacterized membrane protein YkoI